MTPKEYALTAEEERMSYVDGNMLEDLYGWSFITIWRIDRAMFWKRATEEAFAEGNLLAAQEFSYRYLEHLGELA